jgi:uncharacterized protein (DUF1778 family)
LVATKTERVAIRLTSEQNALIRRAAEVEGTDLTNFTVTATLAHAREVLADRRLFILDDAAWQEFLAVLDRPVTPKPRLERLFSEPSPFDTEA